jgi:hypothetical protein
MVVPLCVIIELPTAFGAVNSGMVLVVPDSDDPAASGVPFHWSVPELFTSRFVCDPGTKLWIST